MVRNHMEWYGIYQDNEESDTTIKTDSLLLVGICAVHHAHQTLGGGGESAATPLCCCFRALRFQQDMLCTPAYACDSSYAGCIKM